MFNFAVVCRITITSVCALHGCCCWSMCPCCWPSRCTAMMACRRPMLPSTVKTAPAMYITTATWWLSSPPCMPVCSASCRVYPIFHHFCSRARSLPCRSACCVVWSQPPVCAVPTTPAQPEHLLIMSLDCNSRCSHFLPAFRGRL